jgi:hypothetical protein
MWKFLKANTSRADVIKCLELIIEGNDYVFCDFTDVPLRDPELDAIRLKVLALETSHPPGPGDHDVNAGGREILREMIRDLRSTDSGTAP